MDVCVNLMERFGKRYRVTFDPVVDPHGRQREKIDPMLQVLRCRFGEIYPQGGDMLAIELRNHPHVSRKLKESGCCMVHQEGDGEVSMLFPVEHFETVAEIVKPHRRPRMSDEEREKAIERLSQYQFAGQTYAGPTVRIETQTSTSTSA
ncbi:hypothetical protein [Symmachiella dynata]|uniref:hypothetical protein n=1 Tax=Symmachiella dynata TaxID=2527995 RepID=UPI0030ED0F31